MRRHWLSVAAVALALGLVASSALVQERGGRADRPRRGAAQGGARRGMTYTPARRGMMYTPGGPGSIYIPDLTSRIPGLTDAQRKQVARIREAAIAKMREIQKRMNEDIKRVLKPDQVKLMEQAERRITHRGPGGVILTDEQLAKYNALRAEAAKIEDPTARREAYRKMYEEMQATYTDEQKKQAAEMRARYRRVRGGAGREGGGGRQRER